MAVAGLGLGLFVWFGRPVLAVSDSLIGYWNFDEATGTTSADSSGNGNDGTFTGSGVAHSTVLPPTSCFINTHSLSFSGAGGYVSIPDNATMDPASAISISFWMKANTVSNGYQHIVFKQGPVVTSYGVWLNGDHVYMEDNDNSVRSLASNTAITADAWHYITVTYDGTTQALYIDGALDNSQSLPGITLTYQNSPVKVGSGDYNNPFNGYVDDLRIYGRALSNTEIADLAGGGCGPGVVPNNGIATGVEDAAPNGGDANADGTTDSQQGNVGSFVNTQTNHYVSVAAPNACTLSDLSTASSAAQTVADAGYTYPAGFTNYTASCGTNGYTADITLYFYGVNGQGMILRKYNPTTHHYSTVAATITQVTVAGQIAAKVQYQVADGGPLDTDGAANGVIVDPVGLAEASASSSSAATLTNTGADVIVVSGVAGSLLTAALLVCRCRTVSLLSHPFSHD